MNQIEIQYIPCFDKFVTFLFGEKNPNDPEQRIYNKLLQLEEEDLEKWTNEKLKDYITGQGEHNSFVEDEFEGIKQRMLFSQWYYSPMNWSETSNQISWLDDIYDDKSEEEINEVKEKLYQFQGLIEREYFGCWKIVMMEDYLEMFIQNMTTNELKEYIRNLVDPIEPK